MPTERIQRRIDRLPDQVEGATTDQEDWEAVRLGRRRVRIGLHTGEAIKQADDFFGKSVILAARIASQTLGGQILVSSLLKALVESIGEF